MDSFAKIERNELHQTILAEAILAKDNDKVNCLLAEGAARTVNNLLLFFTHLLF